MGVNVSIQEIYEIIPLKFKTLQMHLSILNYAHTLEEFAKFITFMANCNKSIDACIDARIAYLRADIDNLGKLKVVNIKQYEGVKQYLKTKKNKDVIIVKEMAKGFGVPASNIHRFDVIDEIIDRN